MSVGCRGCRFAGRRLLGVQMRHKRVELSLGLTHAIFSPVTVKKRSWP
jgi:hypothetical protein